MKRYMEMKRELAHALGVEQDEVRANDYTSMWCVKTSRQRELCVVADSVEIAAEVLRARMEEKK